MKTAWFSVTLFLVILTPLFPGGQAEQMYTDQYTERPELTRSLFSGDSTGISEDDIDTILNSKIVIPDAVKITMIKIETQNPNIVQYYGYSYWRSEEYIRTQQSFIDTLTDILEGNERVVEASPLPAMLIPEVPTVASLRESGIRTQSHLVLVFTVTSDIYQKYRFLDTPEIKAYATCEAFILDTQTGIIPFSAIISEDFTLEKSKEHSSVTETMKIAEMKAIGLSLAGLGNEISFFLDNAEKPAAGSGED